MRLEFELYVHSFQIQKRNFAAFSGGYHGKTNGSRRLYHWIFPGESNSDCISLPFPDKFDLQASQVKEYELQCLLEIKDIFSKNPNIGAVVFEPILGAGGNLNGSKDFWQQFQLLCDKNKILTFADEICVGFGRTGHHFSFDMYGLRPDLVAFSKGLASGFPAMVLGGRAEIKNAKPFGDLGGASTTFGGNPLAIAAMYKTTSIYLEQNIDAKVRTIAPIFNKHIEKLKSIFSEISDVINTGLMATIKCYNSWRSSYILVGIFG